MLKLAGVPVALTSKSNPEPPAAKVVWLKNSANKAQKKFEIRFINILIRLIDNLIPLPLSYKKNKIQSNLKKIIDLSIQGVTFRPTGRLWLSTDYVSLIGEEKDVTIICRIKPLFFNWLRIICRG